MIRLLMVDDEQIVRDALIRTIDWASLGYDARVAQNAMEALDMAAGGFLPDILVTDIAMPLISGIELIERMRAIAPAVECIIISGYDEFEYARGALRQGAIRYLLKPFDEGEITAAVQEASRLLAQKRAQRHKAEQGEKLIRMRPLLRRQIVRELTLSGDAQSLTPEELQRLAELPQDGYHVLLLAPAPATDGYAERHLGMLEAEEALRAVAQVEMATAMGQQAILVTHGADVDAMRRLLEAADFPPLLAGISQQGQLTQLPLLLRQARESLLHAALLGERATILYGDIAGEVLPPFELNDLMRYGDLIASGADAARIQSLLRSALGLIALQVTDETQRRIYWMQLFLAIIDKDSAEGRARHLAALPMLSTLPRAEVEALLLRTAQEVIDALHARRGRRIASLAERMRAEMASHLHEDSFSLTTLATDILYANPDYLGRVFRKAYGQTFSQALQAMRMARAAALLADGALSVTQVALETGYGHNAQYFAQVFRKHFGHTPSEHSRMDL